MANSTEPDPRTSHSSHSPQVGEGKDTPADKASPTHAAARLRALRKQRGWSQENLAEATGCSVQSVRRWESGKKPYPDNQNKICRALGTTPADIGWRPCNPPGFDDPPDPPRQETPREAHKEQPHDRASENEAWQEENGDDVNPNRREFKTRLAAGAVVVGAGGLDTLAEILDRIDARKVSMADPSVIALIGEMAADAVRDYEIQDRSHFGRGLAVQRRWVEQFRGGAQPRRPAIEAAACELSGVLSTVAGDIGQHTKALAYSLDARALADEVGDPDLRAWARAQQATAAHTAGRYKEAVALADDGLQIGAGGVHRARLLLRRGRALARMGKVADAREAVARGMDAAQDTDDAAWGCTISLNSYHPVLAAWEGSRALAAAGDVETACHHAEEALEFFDREGMAAPVGRIEIATRLASRDPARAAHLVGEAIDQLRLIRNPFGAVCLREFAASTCHLDAPELREARQRALEVARAAAKARHTAA